MSESEHRGHEPGAYDDGEDGGGSYDGARPFCGADVGSLASHIRHGHDAGEQS